MGMGLYCSTTHSLYIVKEEKAMTKNHGTTSEKLEIGQFVEFSSAVIRSLPREGDSQTVQAWIDNQAALRKALREALFSSGEMEENNVLLVNYDFTVESLVKKGKYGWSNPSISSKKFPTKFSEQHKVETKLFFDYTTYSEDIIVEMKKQGFRPAELHELLTYGIKNPEEQRKYPIIALSSPLRFWRPSRQVAYLGNDRKGRVLDLYYFDTDWHKGCRFLAVREF